MKKYLKGMIKLGMVELGARYGQHRKNEETPRLWVMMYHRILPEADARYAAEEPGMLVTPETLDMHFSVLKQEFTIVSLKDWVTRARSEQPLPEKACAITFDDGWLDNYQYAFPLIKKHQVPVTLYVVSEMLGTNQTFWPNRLARILTYPYDQLVQLEWLHECIRNDAAEVNLTKEFIANTIHRMKRFQDSQLLEWISEAESLLGIESSDQPVMMNWSQLSEMSDSGLVEVGSHTCQHIRLNEQLPLSAAEQEITKSKQQLEAKLGKPIELFCYPNGDYTEQIADLVARHYRSAVTTRRGVNRLTELSPYKLERIGLHNDISDTPKKLLARVGMSI